MKTLMILAFGFLLAAGMVFFYFYTFQDEEKEVSLSKGWWPTWDTFQLGVRKLESNTEGITTNIQQKVDYVQALESFLDGYSDAATLTIYEAILAAAHGVDLKIVLMLDYTMGSDGLVAKKSIKSIKDLKGKTIGLEKGTIAHFTVLKAMEKAGLGQEDVNLVEYNLAQLQNDFINGKIDAAGTYDPYMTEMAKKTGGHVIFSSKEIPRSICDVLIVRDSLLLKNPDIIDHWIKAWNEILGKKENFYEDFLKELSVLNNTSPPDLKNSFEGIHLTDLNENRIAFGNAYQPGYLMEALRHMEKFMLNETVIDNPVGLKDLVYYKGIENFFKQ